jgi:hypothetical protein
MDFHRLVPNPEITVSKVKSSVKKPFFGSEINQVKVMSYA